MSHVAKFGIFELDLDRHELRRKGVRVKLQQQPYEILRLLVEKRGELVSRELIQKTLWPEDHFVDFERGINTAVMRLRQALRESASAPAYIETVAGIGYRLIPPVVDDSPVQASQGAIRSIAILPLQDLSPNNDMQYLVDGMTDALVTAMAVESDWRVVSRSSMRQYKDSTLNIRQIAREVGVQAIVEGSILRSGERIRLSVRLLDVNEDRHLWAQTYERSLGDVLFLQQEVADAIATSARAVIKKDATPAATRQLNPRAYELYLRGNFLLSTRTASHLTRAIEYYENAIFLEPQWAGPVAMLAECYRIREFYDYAKSKDLLSKAEELTEKALRLDPTNAQANATAGALLAFYEWKWNEGLEKIRVALNRDPRSADLEYLCAQILLHMGRYDEALMHIDAALSIDPSSPRLWSYRAQIFNISRRYAECVQESERLLEQNPNFSMALLYYSGALSETGRLHEALVAVEQAYTNTGWSFVIAARMEVRRRLGHSAEVEADMKLLLKSYEEQRCAPGFLSWGYMIAGDVEASLAYLEKAADEHDSSASIVIHVSSYDRVRDSERFVSVLRRMNLRS